MLRFNIRSHGYYYYALTVVPRKLMNISYTYTLSKYYYDKNELTLFKCSVVDQDCTIDGLIVKTAADCVLALIPTPPAGEPLVYYNFSTEQSCAWGIVIVFCCVGSFIVYCILSSVALCCVCYEGRHLEHTQL